MPARIATIATYRAKEILRLHAMGKSPDVIAIRTGTKMSKVLSIIKPQ